ncbi:hypothetical protein [Streptomyces sp. MI02-7b]|uniref:hypothetical protein n=1 Tax=Streptomyces sp. MI02-7b TaxID=462941 RepID=UPI0029AA7D6F|nr:hypothetical protein [Streptomyces sp. MI02-7b]MDX3070924.1 hypothetical protein [Streptomyces sp. MI02-7b]
MRFTAGTTSHGVTERLFGRNGGRQRKAPGTVHRSRRLVTARGSSVAVLDAPGRGARPRSGRHELRVPENSQRFFPRRPAPGSGAPHARG